MSVYPIAIALSLAVGGLMLAIGYSWGRSQREVSPPEVVTSDIVLSEYVQATEELFDRWRVSEDGSIVDYDSKNGQTRFIGGYGILSDNITFLIMRDFALDAKKVRLNTPERRRKLKFDYRATMHDEQVGAELMRAMSFLQKATFDEATGCISGVYKSSFDEVQRIYSRVRETQSGKDWERRRKELEAEGVIQ
jgi:hypothetical protein